MYLAFQIVPIQYILLIILIILLIILILIIHLIIILQKVVEVEDKGPRNMFYYLRYLILGNILMLHFALIHYNMLLF